MEGEKAILEDLQSRNGTFLNGVPVESPTQIHDGDTFSLGPVILTILAISAPGSTDSGLPG